MGDTALIKQFLDLGVQTLLVPMVDTAEQAQQLVRATRYAPEGRARHGQRAGPLVALAGVPAVRARGQPADLPAGAGRDGRSHEQPGRHCCHARRGRRVHRPGRPVGIDGPPGNPGHPEVQAAIHDGIARILRAGKAPGILATTESQARQWLAA